MKEDIEITRLDRKKEVQQSGSDDEIMAISRPHISSMLRNYEGSVSFTKEKAHIFLANIVEQEGKERIDEWRSLEKEIHDEDERIERSNDKEIKKDIVIAKKEKLMKGLIGEVKRQMRETGQSVPYAGLEGNRRER